MWEKHVGECGGSGMVKYVGVVGEVWVKCVGEVGG